MKTYPNHAHEASVFSPQLACARLRPALLAVALTGSLLSSPLQALDTFAPGSNPDGHVPYHAQVTSYFCGAASMEMQLDCDAVRNNNPLMNTLLNGADGVPVPMGFPPPPITFQGNQVVAGGQTYIYGLVHGLNTFNGITYRNLFWPPGAGTDAFALQSGLNLMDSPLVGSPGQHNYISYNTFNGPRASRTIASAIAQYVPWITDIPALPNMQYVINGFYVNDPWDGWVAANPLVINPRTGQPALDRNGNVILQSPGLAENEWIAYRGDLRADGTRRLSEWFKLFNPSGNQPGVPLALSGAGYKFEVEPQGPEPLDDGTYDSIPPTPPELSSPLTAAQALAYATNDLAAKPYMANQPGFHNGNWDVANAMLVKYSDDESSDGDWCIPYEGSGGTNDVTGSVLIDEMTGALDEVIWLNPGDVVPSMTLAQLDTMEMDEYAGIGPEDNIGDPQLSIQTGPTNSIVLTYPVSTSFSYFLQQNSQPGSTNWVAVTNDPVIVSNQNQVTLPIPATGNVLFRLSLYVVFPSSLPGCKPSRRWVALPACRPEGRRPARGNVLSWHTLGA